MAILGPLNIHGAVDAAQLAVVLFDGAGPLGELKNVIFFDGKTLLVG
jgi:hypothetical protein